MTRLVSLATAAELLGCSESAAHKRLLKVKCVVIKSVKATGAGKQFWLRAAVMRKVKA